MRWLVLIFVTYFSLGASNLLAQEPETEAPVKVVLLKEVEVKAPIRPMTYAERRKHWRRIRDVKKVRPYVNYITRSLIETYEYMETLPEDEREEHLDRVTDDLKDYFTPLLSKLTARQGQVLMKLIHRETGTISYELVKMCIGGFRAFFWQSVAHFEGTDLKSPYDPIRNADDALTERVVLLLDRGLLI